MKYQVEVLETCVAKVVYVLEADSPEEALELAEKGETESQILSCFAGGVIDRKVNAETLKEGRP